MCAGTALEVVCGCAQRSECSRVRPRVVSSTWLAVAMPLSWLVGVAGGGGGGGGSGGGVTVAAKKTQFGAKQPKKKKNL